MWTPLGAIMLPTVPACLLFHTPIFPFEEEIVLRHFKFFTQRLVLFLGLCPPVSVSIFSTGTMGHQQNGVPHLLMNWALPFSCFQCLQTLERCGGNACLPWHLTIWRQDCSPFQTAPVTAMSSSQGGSWLEYRKTLCLGVQGSLWSKCMLHPQQHGPAPITPSSSPAQNTPSLSTFHSLCTHTTPSNTPGLHCWVGTD